MEKKTWCAGAAIATLGTVIGTAATWEAGKEWAWYQPIRESLLAVGSWLSASISLPFWQFALLLVCLASASFAVAWQLRKPTAKPARTLEELVTAATASAVNREEVQPRMENVQLTSEQQACLELLSRFEELDKASVAKHLGITLQRAHYHLEEIEDMGLIYVTRFVDGDLEARLNKKGRRELVSRGLL